MRLRFVRASRGNVVRGLDLAVQRMSLGEVAAVKTRFDFGYGHYIIGGGGATPVPPRANLLFTVQVRLGPAWKYCVTVSIHSHQGTPNPWPTSSSPCLFTVQVRLNLPITCHRSRHANLLITVQLMSINGRRLPPVPLRACTYAARFARRLLNRCLTARRHRQARSAQYKLLRQVCPPISLRACPPARLPACLPACLPVRLPACPPARLPTCAPDRLHSCMSTRLPI